jgi:hypothetical protein
VAQTDNPTHLSAVCVDAGQDFASHRADRLDPYLTVVAPAVELLDYAIFEENFCKTEWQTARDQV